MTSILPAHGEMCQFVYGSGPGGPRCCPQRATMLVDSKPLCDKHAALAMMAVCGRAVKIVRR